MDEKITREVLTITQTNISAEDKEISAAFGANARLAMKRARQLMLYGSESAQVSIVRAFIGASARLATVESKVEVEEQRNAFQELLGDMVDVKAIEPLVTPDSIGEVHAAQTAATAPRAED